MRCTKDISWILKVCCKIWIDIFWLYHKIVSMHSKLKLYENVNSMVFTNLIIAITSSSPHPCYLLPLISTLYTCDSESQDNLTCHGPPTNMMGIIIYASLVNYVWVEIAKLQKCAAVNFIRFSDKFYLRNFVLQG